MSLVIAFGDQAMTLVNCERQRLGSSRVVCGYAAGLDHFSDKAGAISLNPIQTKRLGVDASRDRNEPVRFRHPRLILQRGWEHPRYSHPYSYHAGSATSRNDSSKVSNIEQTADSRPSQTQRAARPWYILKWHGHPVRVKSWPRWPCHLKLNYYQRLR